MESGDNSTVEDEQTSRFVEFLGKLLDIEINFAVTEKRAEDYFDPKPARLAVDDKAAKSLDAALSSLTDSLGAPPSVLIYGHECEEPETYESYPVSVLSEMLSSFWKARRAICRVHLLFIAEQTVRTNPESMHLDESELILYIQPVMRRYWEQVEYAYIRLGAYWDRVGQLLDYIFFHIRQYENDSFSSVMGRIQSNMVPCYVSIASSRAFSNIRYFQKSEKEDGLVWLLRRRNLLVHRVGFFVPHDYDEDTSKNPLFVSSHNHLEAVKNNKLKQGDQKLELDRLHVQLNSICHLFLDVLDLSHTGAKLIPRPK